jgi:hypothetical protein
MHCNAKRLISGPVRPPDVRCRVQAALKAVVKNTEMHPSKIDHLKNADGLPADPCNVIFVADRSRIGLLVSPSDECSYCIHTGMIISLNKSSYVFNDV